MVLKWALTLRLGRGQVESAKITVLVRFYWSLMKEQQHMSTAVVAPTSYRTFKPHDNLMVEYLYPHLADKETGLREAG